MAIPIKLEFQPRIPEEEIRRRLERAPVEHADAVMAAYALLQVAHDRGVLDIMRGAIGRGDTMVVKMAQFASEPESMALVRNLISLARIAASVDPELLSRVADELERQNRGQRVGVWESLRGAGKVARASLAFAGAFGRALAKRGKQGGRG
ncbi:MAG: hypothetical protein JWP63_4872 [Candidatus Solibacter sp.]|nr:hypothetical protein [Candidatus Solibacter sp.]